MSAFELTFLSSMGRWPLTCTQNQKNKTLPFWDRTGWIPFHKITKEHSMFYMTSLLQGVKKSRSPLRGRFCCWFNKIKLSLRLEHRAEATVLSRWSKSEFSCLSVSVAVINAPAVHFKQNRWERKKQSRTERKSLLNKGRIYVMPISFPISENSEVLKWSNTRVAFSCKIQRRLSNTHTQGQRYFIGNWLIPKCWTMCKVLHQCSIQFHIECNPKLKGPKPSSMFIMH